MLATGLAWEREGKLPPGTMMKAYDDEAAFDLGYTKPRMLAPQSRTVEVAERVTFNGEVRRPLDDESVRQAIRRLESAGVEAVAVCFLFSFMNPEHEHVFADALRDAHPEWLVTASSDLLPQLREYYRLTTPVLPTTLTTPIEPVERLAV